MKKQDFDALIDALAAAEINAMQYSESEDGGSCNFNQAIVKLSLTAEQRKELAAMGLLSSMPSYYGRGRGWYFVETSLYGQANRRTRMAQASAKALQLAGYNATVYYQLD